MNEKSVYVGLSGGVDSAVSAALLQSHGYDVTGVFIRIALPGYPCTAGQDRIAALRVAAHLDIPFIEIDLSNEYRKAVFEPMLQDFERGRTPNPDAICNREIKFGLFYTYARSQGVQFVATGHYARTRDGLLFAGVDESKDQSYFLWAVPSEQLCNTLFPVGSLLKKQVRETAARFGLPNAARKDSQGLCFLGDIGIEDMLKKEISHESGDVVDEQGTVVGAHEGVPLYTLGQRHGFRVHARQNDARPYFVIGKDIAHNKLIVSHSTRLDGYASTLLTLCDTNWIGDQHKVGSARFRYRGALIGASFSGQQIRLQGAHVIPEGQSLVLYDAKGEQCFGGGIIDSVQLEK